MKDRIFAKGSPISGVGGLFWCIGNSDGVWSPTYWLGEIAVFESFKGKRFVAFCEKVFRDQLFDFEGSIGGNFCFDDMSVFGEIAFVDIGALACQKDGVSFQVWGFAFADQDLPFLNEVSAFNADVATAWAVGDGNGCFGNGVGEWFVGEEGNI